MNMNIYEFFLDSLFLEIVDYILLLPIIRI